MGMYIKLLRQQLSSLCQLRCATYSSFATNLKNSTCNEGSALDQFLDSDGYTWDNYADVRASDIKQAEVTPSNSWRESAIPELLSIPRGTDLYASLARIVQPHVKTSSEGFPSHFLLNTDLSQYVNELKKCDITNLKQCETAARSVLLANLDSQWVNLVQSSAKVKSDSNMNSVVDSDSGNTKDDDDNRDGPSMLQLQDVMNYYIATVPSFHKASGENFRMGMHHKQMVFENYFYQKPIIKRGIQAYRNYLFKINLLATFAYVHYSYEIVSLRSNKKEGSVILHWRVRLLSNTSFMTSLVPRVLRGASINDQYRMMDGISTFFVDKDGKIFKHKVERLTPLNEPMSATETIASKILSNAVPKVNISPTSLNEQTNPT